MKNDYKVKICGTTNIEDAKLAAEQGADYFGVVVEVDFSPRSLSVEQAKPLFSDPPISDLSIPGVALVFKMDPGSLEIMIKTLNPFAVQFLYPEDIALIKNFKKAYPSVQLWQSVHLPQAGQELDPSLFKKTIDVYIEAGIDSILLDTLTVSQGKMKFGGTGITSDWKIVKSLMQEIEVQGIDFPIWLAGGINPENVGEALDFIDPYGIDLCSGLEAEPGRKDPLKIKKLMSIIKEKSSDRR
ncbi:phosphoribosylanthranilate isomerase [Desulfobacterales bacterium HSG17]|nr:phosphoribosylanthranilate isomerase [Desulfobacterales bacterium HSG17]